LIPQDWLGNESLPRSSLMMGQANQRAGKRFKRRLSFRRYLRARIPPGNLTFVATAHSTIRRLDWITLRWNFKTISRPLATSLLMVAALAVLAKLIVLVLALETTS
jgi:hypothetical protein